MIITYVIGRLLITGKYYCFFTLHNLTVTYNLINGIYYYCSFYFNENCICTIVIQKVRLQEFCRPREIVFLSFNMKGES